MHGERANWHGVGGERGASFAYSSDDFEASDE